MPNLQYDELPMFDDLTASMPSDEGVRDTGAEEVEPSSFPFGGTTIDPVFYSPDWNDVESGFHVYSSSSDLLEIGGGLVVAGSGPLPIPTRRVFWRSFGAPGAIFNLYSGIYPESFVGLEGIFGESSNVAKFQEVSYTPTPHKYDNRLKELRAIAKDEGFQVDEKSVQFFATWLSNAPFQVRRAGLALGEQGEINAVWVSKDRETRLSIEVRSNGEIEYAWLPSEGPVTVKPIDSSEFWSHIGPAIRRFLVDAG